MFVSASNELRMLLGVGPGCYHANSLESCIRHPSDGVGNYPTEITVQTQKLLYRHYRTVQTQKLQYRHRNYCTDTEITVQTQKLLYGHRNDRTDTEITVQTQKLLYRRRNYRTDTEIEAPYIRNPHSEHRFPAPSSKLCQNLLRH